jgi:hypothetical protein
MDCRCGHDLAAFYIAEPPLYTAMDAWRSSESLADLYAADRADALAGAAEGPIPAHDVYDREGCLVIAGRCQGPNLYGTPVAAPLAPEVQAALDTSLTAHRAAFDALGDREA